MDGSAPITALLFFTLLAVLAYALWQWRRVRESQRVRGETPGAARVNARTLDQRKKADDPAARE